ncbi:MAG: Dabb family protein [Verrucomicrobiaceae bacterium]
MIHTVFFWLKKEITAEQRSLFENELIKLKEIPCLIHGFVGKPAPTEHRLVTDHSFDFSLTLHFKNLEDHEHYQKDCEQHKRFVTSCKSFWERVQVYDSSPIH